MSPIIPFPTDVPENGRGNNSTDDDGNQAVYIVLSDSDSQSDEENPGYEGYEPLSQDPEIFIDNQCNIAEDSNFLSEEEPSAIEVTIINHHSLMLPAPEVTEINTELTEEFKMDEERIETIKSVMKNITLPTSNLPQWASLVPEDEWKTTLFSEMLIKKGSKNLDKRRNGSKFSLKDNSPDFQNDIPR